MRADDLEQQEKGIALASSLLRATLSSDGNLTTAFDSSTRGSHSCRPSSRKIASTTCPSTYGAPPISVRTERYCRG